ncbi:MAG: hypothetical protein ACHQT9_00680 [Candidatus Saccharimonadales bacterium]
MAKNDGAISGNRLRLGIVFILLWWIPLWAAAPSISHALGYSNDPKAQHAVFIGIIIIQTVFGAIGILLCSKDIVTLVKKVPKRSVLKVLFLIVLRGSTESIKELNTATDKSDIKKDKP